VAHTLHQLGMFGASHGEYAEARRQYEASLAIKRTYGQGGRAITTAQMRCSKRRRELARRGVIRAAEAVFVELGSPMRRQARKVRERLEKEMPRRSSPA